LGDELKAVDIRHQKVETNQIEMLDFHQAQHLTGVGNGDGPVAVRLQPFADSAEDIGVVIDEKNSHFCEEWYGSDTERRRGFLSHF